jgi:hypothetical protein
MIVLQRCSVFKPLSSSVQRLNSARSSVDASTDSTGWEALVGHSAKVVDAPKEARSPSVQHLHKLR